ncbi:MAG: hypothetical protein CMP10_17925 [Zetaproteobacteria bacterium]|nr:hypothetical protein [Pseudobdellovibrionaceae bacterium]
MTKKNKGLFNFKTWSPVIIGVVSIVVYYIAFFDLHMRMGLESIGTLVNGAEVNVASFQTKFLDSSVAIQGIEITNEKKPEENKLQLEEISMQASWDGLLRAKLVVEQAIVKNIQIGTKRSSPGYVVPVEESEVSQSEEESSDANGFQDAISALSGNEQVQEIQEIGNMSLEDLPSNAKIAELEKGLSLKQKEWEQAYQKLPDDKFFEAEQLQLAQIKLSKNPAELKNQFEMAKNTLNSVKAKASKVTKEGSQLQNEISSFKKESFDIDAMIDADVAYMKSKLKLPDLDFAKLGKDLFGEEFGAYVEQAQHYYKLAQQYMPPPSDKGQAPPPPPSASLRMAGRSYDFGKKGDYPLVWIKKVSITSEAADENSSGAVAGEVNNLTSSQRLVGEPTTASIEGDFPKEEILGFKLNMLLDHRNEPSVDKLDMTIRSFGVQQKVLSSSPELTLAIAKGKGRVKADAKLESGEVYLKMVTNFNEVVYDVEAKKESVKELLVGTMAGIPKVVIVAVAKGKIDAPDVAVSSNLTDALKASLSRVLKAKTSGMQGDLRKKVEDRIKGKTDVLNKQWEQATGPILDGIKAKFAAATGAEKQAEGKVSQVNGGVANQKKAAQAKLDQAKADAQAKAEAARRKVAEEKRRREKAAKDKAEQKVKKQFGDKLKKFGM